MKGIPLEDVVKQQLVILKRAKQVRKGTTIDHCYVREDLQQVRVHLSDGTHFTMQWRTPDQPNFGKEN